MIKAIVYRKTGKRFGKGFSKEELKAVGLSFKEALKIGIPVDVRRRTAHKENIDALKSYLDQLSKKA
jgi:large subunit ribosomal protein L13e